MTQATRSVKTGTDEPSPTAPIERLRENIAKVFLGSRASIDTLICCLLARGHVLIEDVPGVGKTVLAMALARSIDCVFSRIQLTPDLLPSDVLGVSIFDRGTGEFVFKPGPIFANIVLTDEINRTPPRTQTALLEAMSEGSVSVDGKTTRLDPPFMVVATQNPSDYEGTYPLPENQLDRFLMRVSLGYPSPADEARVLDLRPASTSLPELRPVLSRAEVLTLQERVDGARVDRSLLEYIVAFANATRRDDRLRVGVSPRGALALAQVARATAVFQGRDYVVPDDILRHVIEVCAHRVIVRSSFTTASEPPARILQSILETIASPA